MLQVRKQFGSNWARVLGGALAGTVMFGGWAGAQSTPVFAATDLAGVSAVFLAFLAVGAAITIAMTLYRKGRQGANKV